MGRRKDGFLTGCVHNTERVFKMPEQVRNNHYSVGGYGSDKYTYAAGMMGALVCPHAGCPVIYINIGVEVSRRNKL